MENIRVMAPIPIPRIIVAEMVNPGFREKDRKANLTSLLASLMRGLVPEATAGPSADLDSLR
jgi:hypothetical protein